MTQIQLPLAIGVTGHRNILQAAKGQVEACVVQALDLLEAEFGCDMVVLSPLAEGADRIVARIALSRNISVVAPLPMSIEDYEADFQTHESLSEFRELLTQVKRHYVVDESMVPALGQENLNQLRIAGYRRVGEFVARNCHVLLALWDGREAAGIGGTGEVVRLKRAGVPVIGRVHPTDIAPRDARELVLHIQTPRTGVSEHILPKLVQPERKSVAWRSLSELMSRTRRFNAEVSKDSESEIANSGLVKEPIDQAAPLSKAYSALSRTMHLQAASDSLASIYQARVRQSWAALFLFASLAVVFYSVFAHVEGHDLSALGAYLAALAISFITYRFAHARGWQNRFLDYRALAEALRVFFFWRILKANTDMIRSYPANLASEISWVTEVIKVEYALACGHASPERVGEQEVNFVIENWVEPQRQYFHKASKKNRSSAKRYRTISLSMIFLGMLTAAILLAVLLQTPNNMHLAHSPALIVGITSIALLPGIGALVSGYADRRGFEIQERQYERMAALFERAAMLLQDAESQGEKRELLDRLLIEALSEHAQWIVIHRDRELEFVAGG